MTDLDQTTAETETIFDVMRTSFTEDDPVPMTRHQYVATSVESVIGLLDDVHVSYYRADDTEWDIIRSPGTLIVSNPDGETHVWRAVPTTAATVQAAGMGYEEI